VGGTSARRWTAAEVIDTEPTLKPFAAAIKKGVAGKSGKGKPGDLYASLIKPLIPFAIRGVIWYQGESDAGHPDEYAALFPAMIRSWRAAWKHGDFPFLYVQLAPIGGRSGWERLREVQLQTLSVPKTALAVIIDGDAGIHPLKKQLPGGRLALAARALAYGEKIVYSGPIYKSMKRDGDRIVLNFDHGGGGLVAKGETLTGFTVLDEDGKSHAAQAKIEGDKVIVSSKDATKPVAVRYGWASNPGCNLCNKEGLPASPFRTDRGKK
jgi:sialate O-acetylesterase